MKIGLRRELLLDAGFKPVLDLFHFTHHVIGLVAVPDATKPQCVDQSHCACLHSCAPDVWNFQSDDSNLRNGLASEHAPTHPQKQHRYAPV
jgi:hypothetical protein